MRLCRFELEDEVVLVGFYADDHVIPLDQALEAHADATGVEPWLADPESLLALAPGGEVHEAARDLAVWIDGLDAEARAELSVPIEDVRLLRPIEWPGKILLLAGNYAEHVEERGYLAAERQATFPYVFMKPLTTMIDPGQAIVIPKVSPHEIDWECELGVVIGSPCKNVSEEEALDYVAGYTVVNDVSDRSFKPNPGRTKRERDAFFDWLHGKWHDTFCPTGPCLLTADAVDDPQTLGLRLTVNDQVMQDSSTAKMVFPVAAVVSFLSSFVTLEPGDLIATGTPAGVGKARGIFLKPGDRVTAEIAGIGPLINPVEAEE